MFLNGTGSLKQTGRIPEPFSVLGPPEKDTVLRNGHHSDDRCICGVWDLEIITKLQHPRTPTRQGFSVSLGLIQNEVHKDVCKRSSCASFHAAMDGHHMCLTQYCSSNNVFV